MSLFGSPEEHAANPPETWRVIKVAERCWHLTTANGGVLHSATTRHTAEALKTNGFYFDLYNDEARWYAGENVRGWRPYSEIRQENAMRFYGRLAS